MDRSAPAADKDPAHIREQQDKDALQREVMQLRTSLQQLQSQGGGASGVWVGGGWAECRAGWSVRHSSTAVAVGQAVITPKQGLSYTPKLCGRAWEGACYK